LIRRPSYADCERAATREQRILLVNRALGPPGIGRVREGPRLIDPHRQCLPNRRI
jgi:hypothetical protein